MFQVCLGVSVGRGNQADEVILMRELAYLIGGVSEKMLSQTLRRLEMVGVVRREVHTTKPPKVEYSLLPLGCELGLHVQALLGFVHKNANRVLKNRESARRHEPSSVIA